jgi:hypothetical protein
VSDQTNKSSYQPLDPLDELLAQARWLEPVAGAEARLRATLLATPTPPIVTPRAVGWAVAAAIVLAIGGTMAAWHMRHTTGNQQIAGPVAPSIVPPPQADARGPRIVARAPTLNELLIATPTPRRSPHSSVAASAVATVDPPRPLDTQTVITRLADPSTRFQTLAQLHQSHPSQVESLMSGFDDPLVSRRMVAAQAIGELADGATIRRLIAQAETGPHRREALAALAASPRPEAVQYIQATSASPSRRSELAAIRSEFAADF